MPLSQLMYCSRIAIPVPDLDGILAGLYTTASARNQKNDVTGCLAYNRQWFIQVIEGAEEAVEETFDRIARDTRHTSVKILNWRAIRGRSFPDWHMAAIRLCDQPQPLLDAHGLGADFDPDAVLGAKLLMLLMSLADHKRMQP